MSKLPRVGSRDLIRALKRAGFQEADRSPGGHQTFYKEAGARKIVAVVPVAKKDLPVGTLAAILRQAEISKDEFLDFLK